MAFLFDTSVLSETRQLSLGRGSRAVRDWLTQRDADTFFLSAITIFETEVGIRLVELRNPKQGEVLRGWFDMAVLPAFAARVLPVDAAVTQVTAILTILDPRPLANCLIAATAIVHGFSIVTRNVADFQGLPVAVVNPWAL
jgi:toxin FitB